MFFPRSQNWIQSWPWGRENSGRNLQKGVRIKELHKSEDESMFWGYYSISAGTPWQFAEKCGARAPNVLVQERSQGYITKLFLSIFCTIGVILCFDGICVNTVLINLRQSMHTLKQYLLLPGLVCREEKYLGRRGAAEMLQCLLASTANWLTLGRSHLFWTQAQSDEEMSLCTLLQRERKIGEANF